MKVLARSQKGKEFFYSRKDVIQIPKSWNEKKVNAFIDGLNRFFKLPENETYYPHMVDRYDNIFPAYKATCRKGATKLIPL